MASICPRQDQEAVLAVQRAHVAHWREDGSCSYCGSITEAAFFAAIEAGRLIGPTDKNYKAYVDLPNPNAGTMRICAWSNSKPSGGDKWIEVTQESLATLPPGAEDSLGQWVQVMPEGESRRDKFYFQHLSSEGRKRLVEMINAKSINFDYPGCFYVLPFFVVVENRINADG